MRARVTWLDHMSFVGESPNGNAVVMDGPPESGGRDLGTRPMEMVLLGLGGCTAYDVVYILKRGRQAVTGCEVFLDAERATTVPKVFTKIHLTYVITGHKLDPSQVERAVKLSAEKYCSVSRMLEATVSLSHSTTIREATEGFDGTAEPT